MSRALGAFGPVLPAAVLGRPERRAEAVDRAIRRGITTLAWAPSTPGRGPMPELPGAGPRILRRTREAGGGIWTLKVDCWKGIVSASYR